MQIKQLEQAIQILKENDFSVKHWENYGKERYYITSDRFRLNVFISIEENGIFLNTKSQSETKTVLQHVEEILDTEAITEKIGCLFRCEKRVPLFFIAEKEQQTEEVAVSSATETVFENEENETLENGTYKIHYIHGDDGAYESETTFVFRLEDGQIYPISIKNEVLTEEEVFNDLDYRLILKNLKKSDMVRISEKRFRSNGLYSLKINFSEKELKEKGWDISDLLQVEISESEISIKKKE